MRSRLFACGALLILSISPSCSQAGHDEIVKEGIYVTGPYRDGSKLKIVVRSENPNFDCINLNGINGSGEILKTDGGRNPSIVKSDGAYGKSDILYFDNKPIEKLVHIYGRSKSIIIDRSFKYILMPIFNCRKFYENTPQYVYMYTLPSL